MNNFNLELLKPNLKNNEDIYLMIETVKKHPAFKNFEQNGNTLLVEGFLECGECGRTGTRKDFNADDPTADDEFHVQCAYCKMVSEECHFPDAHIWDVFDYIIEKNKDKSLL